MKKVLIILGVIIVLIAGGVGYMLLSSEKKISNGTLSARAKEYINSKKSGNDSLWRGVDIENKRAAVPKTVEVSKTGCFSFVIPMKLSIDHPREGCSVEIATDEPKTMVVAAVDKTTVASVSDISGVQLRRMRKEEYKEDTITANGKTYTSFKKTVEGYERDIFLVTPKGVFSLAMTANTNEDLDTKFKEMVVTLKLE